MTILAVDKQRDKIYVASDSRYSIGTKRIDCGTKVFSTKCTIRGPFIQSQSINVGFAFDGCVTNFFNFKNRIDFTLQNIFSDTVEDDLDQAILDLVKEEFETLCQQSEDAVDIEGDLLFFKPQVNGQGINAYCLSFNSVTRSVIIKEITDPLTFYGSGKDPAETLLRSGTPYINIVRFLKEVIEKSGCDTIGGNIQIGELTCDGFRVLGYQDFDVQSTSFGPYYYYGSAKMKNKDHFLPLGASFLQIYTNKEQAKMAEENTKYMADLYKNKK